MIDVEKIVNESQYADNGKDPDYGSNSARRAVALTLRAVAEDLRHSQKDARPLLSLHVQTVVKLVDGIANIYDSQAAAIEKGGG